MIGYDRDKNGWNRDWETDNIPDDMSGVHIETCDGCDFPVAECKCPEKDRETAKW